MLNVPNLDDQRYDEILESARNRIPYLYDEWTDFNAHDPGITILELFAWYKQMQQYHLNRMTDRHKLKLLKLLGVEPEGLRETTAMVHFSGETRGQRFARGTRLISEGGVSFELSDTVTAGEIIFREAYILRGDGMHDVTSVLENRQVPLKLGEGDLLYLGFDGLENRRAFRLWFDIGDSYPVRRNPFQPGDAHPRTIEVEAVGENGPVPLEVVRDETYSLSISGAMDLNSPEGFPLTDGGFKLPERCWLTIRITDSGCEENPAILSLMADFAAVRQRTTRSELNEFTVAEESAAVVVDSCLALHGKTDVFVRNESGWYEIKPERKDILEKDGAKVLRLEIKAEMLAQDGKPNVRVVCYEPAFEAEIRRHSTGLPNQQIRLMLSGGERLLTDGLRVMCRGGDGRYRDWRYVASLEDAAPHESVFTYNEHAGLVFGDNLHGAVPEAGKNAVYLAGFALTEGADGSITDGQKLYLAGGAEDKPSGADGERAAGSAFNVKLGRDRESIDAAIIRMQSAWKEGRTATAADFERVALQTPGRRVWQAKALPLYRPDAVIQEKVPCLLTLVVLPYSEKPFPMPDERFLESVRRHVEKHRLICMQVQVIAPVYVPVNITADVVADADEQTVYRKVRQALESYFSLDAARELGAPVSQSGVISAIGGVDCVLGVTDVHIAAEGNRNQYNKHGDILIQKHGIAYLGRLELRVSRQ